MITATPVETKNFSWDLTLNLSGNRGRLGKFMKGVDWGTLYNKYKDK